MSPRRDWMRPPAPPTRPRRHRGVEAQPVGEGFGPYVGRRPFGGAARHGLRPETVLKFDQNTPPLPGIPQVPLAESMARLNEYPEGAYADLRAAAAAYTGLGAGERRRRRGR